MFIFVTPGTKVKSVILVGNNPNNSIILYNI